MNNHYNRTNNSIAFLSILRFTVPILITITSMASWAESEAGPAQNDLERSPLSSFLEEEKLEVKTESARIRYKDFDSWEKIDDYHIMVTSKHPDKKYLLSFKSRCQQLEDDDTGISFKSTSSYISKLDTIYVARRTDLTDIDPSGIPTRLLETCVIENIVELQMPDDTNGEK